MKLTIKFPKDANYLLLVLVFISLLTFVACNDDDSIGLPYNKTPGDGGFYRLNDFGEVNVIPENRQVRVLIRVTDSLNYGITDLDKNDFEVLENNIDKVSDIESGMKIDPESIPYTIKTVLLLDMSSSVEENISQIKSAVSSLIQSKVGGQQFAIYAFDSNVEKIIDFTEDTSQLLDAIENLPESGLDNSTNLYQAIIDASKAWNDRIEIDQIEEGSLVIFTDGKHNADPGLDVNDALRAIEKRAVYVAALNSPNLDESVLKIIAAEQSRYLYADDVTSLANVFLDIQDRILTQSKSIYYITYTSPISVPGVQNLKIMIKDNSNPGIDCMVEKNFSTNGF